MTHALNLSALFTGWVVWVCAELMVMRLPCSGPPRNSIVFWVGSVMPPGPGVCKRRVYRQAQAARGGAATCRRERRREPLALRSAALRVYRFGRTISTTNAVKATAITRVTTTMLTPRTNSWRRVRGPYVLAQPHTRQRAPRPSSGALQYRQ